MKEHVQESDGGRFCAHCGGAVDAEGYADGGEVEGEVEAMQEGDTAEEPQQYSATRRMRSLAEALSTRRGG